MTLLLLLDSGAAPGPVQSVEHVSPYCVKVNFVTAMRNNSDLRDVQYYTIDGGLTITDVEPEYSQSQEYVSSSVLGGSPSSVYLWLDGNPHTAGSTIAGMTSTGASTVVDFDGSAVSSALSLASLTPVEPKDIDYWASDGVRTKETFNELGKLGRAKWTTGQPINYSAAHMIGKLNEMMSGGLRSKLDSAIDGPDDPIQITTFSSSGFASSPVTVPGIGTSFSFKDDVIPCHVDKLWGVSNGSNRLFRTTISFHSHACILLVAEGKSDSVDQGLIDFDRWYAPNTGYDRQIVMKVAPPKGATIIAIFIPRRSLLQIGHEIIAYEESDIVNGTAVIYGRAQLMSDLEAHAVGDYVEDVWATSFVKRAEYNILAMGGSGRALEYIGMDSGSPRSDNPTLNDTDLRRMIYHTSVTMRGVPGTVWEGVRYIYPKLWPHIQIGEDPRWPDCLAIWFSNDDVIGDLTWITSPNVEPWETWLDEVSYPDGMPTELIAETYYRDDGVDAGTYGDYLLADFTEDPAGWPYPVILSGAVVYLLGIPAPSIPAPASTSSDYKQYLVRPPGLDKVLPIGCGVLLLDTSYL